MFTISLKMDADTINQIYEVRDATGTVIGTLTKTANGFIASDLDVEANPDLVLTDLGSISLVDNDPNDFLDISEPFGSTRVDIKGSKSLDYSVKISKGEIL